MVADRERKRERDRDRRTRVRMKEGKRANKGGTNERNKWHESDHVSFTNVHERYDSVKTVMLIRTLLYTQIHTYIITRQ